MNGDHHPVGRPSAERGATIDRAELRKRAEEATKGEWSLFIPDRGYCSNYIVTDLPERAPDEHHRFRHVVADYDDCGKGELDAMFAVAAQPTTVLALLDRIEELEAAVAPFADFGEYLEVETEGFSDADELSLEVEETGFRLDKFKVGDFHRARKALSGEKP